MKIFTFAKTKIQTERGIIPTISHQKIHHPYLEQLNGLSGIVEHERLLDLDQGDIVKGHAVVPHFKIVVDYDLYDVVQTAALVVKGGTSAHLALSGIRVNTMAGCYDPVFGDDGSAAGVPAVFLQAHLVRVGLDYGALATHNAARVATDGR